MIKPLTVALDTERREWAAALVASLPASLRLTQAQSADIGLVDGAGDWPLRAQALAAGGVRRILVIEPAMADPATVQQLAAFARERGVEVHLGEGFAGNPALAGFRDWLAGEFNLLTLCGHGDGDVAGLLLQQLRVARAIGFSSVKTENAVVMADAAVVTLAGELGGRPMTLRMNVSRTGAASAQHRLAAYGPGAAASLTLHDGWIARPAEAILFGSDGLRGQPSIYETGHRAALRALLAERAQTDDDIPHWERDAAFAQALCRER
jgi:hypothetical protein